MQNPFAAQSPDAYRNWAVTVETDATVEPLTVTEAKLHLRLDVTADDDLVSSLIVAARKYCETVTRRAFVNKTLTLSMDAFPPQGNDPIGSIWFPVAPLSSVTWVKYYDTSGTLTTLSSSNYVVDTAQSRVACAYSNAWPVTQVRPSAVTIRFVAGYGATAASVPDTIKSAMRLLIGHWYENREAVTIGGVPTQVPLAVESLLVSEKHGTYP